MPARGHERFTVIFVPHSARPTAALRLSSRTIQILCAVLIVAFFSLTVFAARYAQLVSYMHELLDLRMLTAAQEEQLRLLQGTASELRERLGDLAKLDTELRQLLSLDPPTTPIEELLTARKSVTIAKGPSVSLSSMDATATTLAVEASLMAKAGYLTDTFTVLREEMEESPLLRPVVRALIPIGDRLPRPLRVEEPLERRRGHVRVVRVDIEEKAEDRRLVPLVDPP